MHYKRLGHSGLKVSSLCMGTMTFGDGADEATSAELYGLCRDRGINFFDCANVYAGGDSERILGRLIKAHRQQVVVASKAYYPTGEGINDRGGSRFHLTKALETSLKNLDTDYLDLFYLHCFDTETPLEESMATLNDFVRQGKVLYLGLSNFAAWQVMKAVALADRRHWASITCIQPMYNLLKRQVETELLPMARHEGLGVCPYSPLAGGLLTGKYLLDANQKGRFDHSEMYQKRYGDPANEHKVKAFHKLARDWGLDSASLAVAWVASRPGVTAPLIGARTVAQLEPSLKGLAVPVSEEMMKALDQVCPPPPLATDRTEEQK